MKTKVLFHGLGGMGEIAAKHILNTQNYQIMDYVYDASKAVEKTIADGLQVRIINDDPDYKRIPGLMKIDGPHFIIDFATSPKDSETGKLIDPDLPRRFVEMCCKYGIPFVRGSTQPAENFGELEKMIENSGICAVIAPNMAPPIVAFQKTVENFANMYDYTSSKGINHGILNDCTLDIVESHQKTKTDTSGTARAMIEKPNGQKGYFNRLGIPYKESDIIMIRDREGYSALGVPEKSYNGHGWHSYIVQNKSEISDGINSLIDEMKQFLRPSTKVFSDYELNCRLDNFNELSFVMMCKNLEVSDKTENKNNVNDYLKRFDGIMPNLNYLEQKIGKKIDVTNALVQTSNDGTVGFGLLYKPGETCVIIHNVNGREVYGTGVVNALDFLTAQTSKGEIGKVYNMMDVLGLK